MAFFTSTYRRRNNEHLRKCEKEVYYVSIDKHIEIQNV